MLTKKLRGGLRMRRLWQSEPARFVRDVVELYFSAHASRSAAELAYFLILSFFPVLICVNAFVGALHLDISPALDGVERFLPGEVTAILTDYVEYISANRSPGMFLAGLFVILVSASAAVRAPMKITDDIYGSKSYPGPWGVVVSMGVSLLLLLTVYLSIIVLLTGGWFLRLLARVFPAGAALRNWRWLRFVILFALVLLFISLLYRFSAPRGVPGAPVLPGAVLAAVALAGASVLFSWFIGMSSRYSMVYGSLASVIILLVWLYLCGSILILGSLINCVLHRRRKRSK